MRQRHWKSKNTFILKAAPGAIEAHNNVGSTQDGASLSEKNTLRHLLETCCSDRSIFAKIIIEKGTKWKMSNASTWSLQHSKKYCSLLISCPKKLGNYRDKFQRRRHYHYNSVKVYSKTGCFYLIFLSSECTYSSSSSRD